MAQDGTGVAISAQFVAAYNVHHERFRFGWKMVVADGSTALEGMDFGELDEKGQIRRITGFFGPLGPRP
jgi:hypothetical protein